MKECFTQSFNAAKILLMNNSRLELGALILLTINELPDKDLYSSKGVQQAWIEHKKRLASHDFLETYCNSHHWNMPSAKTLIESVKRATENSYDPSYLQINGEDASGEIPPEIWYHLEIILDRTLEDRPTQFSCSC